jgi:hypothetical protein
MPPLILIIEHNAGFFSCCSVFLFLVIDFFNKNKRLPDGVDSSRQFDLYKPVDSPTRNVTFDFFDFRDYYRFSYEKDIVFLYQDQFSNYKNIDFKNVVPFVEKYLSPSHEVSSIIENIENKYNLTKNFYENLCVLFYRGNDKSTEVALCSYEEIIEKAKEIIEKHPGVHFLIQSDETEFIESMKKEFPNNICFEDEIRHMPRNPQGTVDNLDKSKNYEYAKKFLAITIIMSKAKHVIFPSGNCSLWITLYRGNAENTHQFLNNEWL